MIQKWLDDNKKPDYWANTPEAKKAIQGEKVALVLQLNEDETLFLCESNCSFAIHAIGAFEIMGAKETARRISEWVEKNKLMAASFNELSKLTGDKKDGSEQHNPTKT